MENSIVKWKQDLFSGLKALSESAFPKKCQHCGKVYSNILQFTQDTQPIRAEISGFKESKTDQDTILELFLNCACGSTLMDFFQDRRDSSPQGLQRRQLFGEILENLINAGLNHETARKELLKVLNGGQSAILSNFTPRSGTA